MAPHRPLQKSPALRETNGFHKTRYQTLKRPAISGDGGGYILRDVGWLAIMAIYSWWLSRTIKTYSSYWIIYFFKDRGKKLRNLWIPPPSFRAVCSLVTLPETNIAPESRSSQQETSSPTIHFHVQAVSFREGNMLIPEPQPAPCSKSPGGTLPIPRVNKNCKRKQHWICTLNELWKTSGEPNWTHPW